MQFQCNIAVAQAHIVHGVQIISSPGDGSIAPIEQIKPDVHELTEIAYLTLKSFDVIIIINTVDNINIQIIFK